MKAWQLNGINEPLELIERDDPKPGPGEIVLHMRAAGLCHSDVGFMEGTLQLVQKTPIILGHESAGIVAELGPDVSDFRIGDRVVISGTQDSMPGVFSDGGYATHCLVNAKALMPLPDNVSFIQGATATDAGSTSYAGVVAAGELKPGQRVGIVGLGGLGMVGARLALLNGASEIYGAEPRKEVWSVAKEQGVIDVYEDVNDLAELGLDLIVDYAGFGTTTDGAIKAVRPGGIVVQVGLGKNEATINTEILCIKNITLRGARGGYPDHLRAVLDHMSKGELEIKATAISFGEIPAGLEKLKKGGVTGRLVAELKMI